MSPERRSPEHERSTGARPAGVTTEEAAAADVQQMFDTIAPTYDRANHLLSAGLDRWLWGRSARRFRPVLRHPETVALDVCCGTGDMTMALLKYRPAVSNAAPILAVDFSHQMLSRGREKFALHNIVPIEADALHLPIANASVDLVTSAFGFRNLANYDEGLMEFHRVLRPGGQIGILECNQPEGLTGALYDVYFKTVLPKLGGLISGNVRAYTYLPASVERFPRPPRMLQLIKNCGFTNSTWTSYAFGTAGLYHAIKP